MAEAKSAVGNVCSQLILLDGTLDMSSKLSGPRTADVKNVAFNRTVGAGVSVGKVGTPSVLWWCGHTRVGVGTLL